MIRLYIADTIGYVLILFTISMIHFDDWPRILSIIISNMTHSQSVKKIYLKKKQNFGNIIKLQYMQFLLYLCDLDYVNTTEHAELQNSSNNLQYHNN